MRRRSHIFNSRDTYHPVVFHPNDEKAEAAENMMQTAVADVMDKYRPCGEGTGWWWAPQKLHFNVNWRVSPGARRKNSISY